MPFKPAQEARLREKVPVLTRVLKRLLITDTCWLWQGALNDKGYGVVGRGGRGAGNARVHRVTYEAFRGPLADECEPDHTCRVRSCANPWHLEEVTPSVNVRRGLVSALRVRITHCKQGHELTPENVRLMPGYPMSRKCKQCTTEAKRRWKQDNREEYLATKKAEYQRRKTRALSAS